ncbi:MAG: AI-2E family transporter [Solirubrobacteraceae bacterium]
MRSAVAYRAVGLAAALIIGALVVQQLMTLVLAATLTILLSLPLAWAASVAERGGVPRALGALGGLVVGFGLLSGLGFAVIPAFASQAKQFADRLPAILGKADRYIHGLAGAGTHSLSSQLSGFVQGYTRDPARLIGPIEQIGLTAVVGVLSLVLIVLAAFLIAVNPGVLVKSTLRLVPENRHDQAGDLLDRVRTAWLGWMTAVGIDMLVLGGLLFVGMKLIGLNFAIGFAVFSAFMTIIPNYGSVISAVPPILYGLAQSPGKALLVVVVYLIVNQIEGNLILPLIMARSVDMHPAVVAMGLLVMGALFGLIGVLLAIPLLSLAIILVQVLWIEPQEARDRRDRGPSAGGVTATSGPAKTRS